MLPTSATLHKIPFVDLSAQYSTLSTEIDEAIARVLRQADFILGQDVDLFEKEFAAFCGVEYAVSVDSGMSALELALRAYKIGPGDEVITAANTFIASALAISHTGAIPVLVDVDPKTHTIDASAVERALTSRTKAILPVHLYGHPCDMDPILDLAQQRHLTVIEDACQAHGAKYKGKRVGSLGNAAAFSFYPGKNLGAYGDGGMVVSNDKRVVDSIRALRNYGQQAKYHHSVRGYNHRLDTLQAAILRAKLPHLDDWNKSRSHHADLYERLLSESTVVTPTKAAYAEPVWHLYVIRVRNRSAVMNALAAAGIGYGIHYPIPIHLQPAYEDLGYRKGQFPVTEDHADHILSLPMYAELEPAAIARVVDIIRNTTAEPATLFSGSVTSHLDAARSI